MTPGRRPLKPVVPRAAEVTTRRTVIELLSEETLTAREISGRASIPEREVGAHLEHVRRSLESSGGCLQILPPYCRRCGFVFSSRNRLSTPGKCPACRSGSIADPRFHVIMPDADR